jgi:putative secretion ATPase (PEP-CTERM system associated)
MYTEFYRLNARPFQLTPDPRFYFDSATHRKAMAYLAYGLQQGEGFIIITGDIGAGKTTLVARLMEQIDKSRLVAAKIVTTQLDADNLLRMVASAFGIVAEGLDKAQLLGRIEQFLRAQHRDGRRVLLVIDEAQNLPIAALEELRMLSNFTEGSRALLQTFLLGQPEFRDHLAASPDLEQLRQRVIATHHLEPMSRDELPGYIEHRLRVCGWNGDPSFDAKAYEAMYEYSGGVPRRLNTLASRVLLFGALEEKHAIDEGVLNEVIADLQRDTANGGGPEALAPIAPAGQGNVPRKMQTAPAAANGQADADLLRRLDTLEGYVRSQDRVLRQLLDLLVSAGEDQPEAARQH